MHTFRIVTRWILTALTPIGPKRLTFDHVSYVVATDKRAARAAVHATNRAGLARPTFNEPGAEDWTYKLVRSRAIPEGSSPDVNARAAKEAA